MLKAVFTLSCLLAGAFAFHSCSAGSSGGGTGLNPNRTAGTYTYSTTSNVGDYAEWTFNGSAVTAVWQEVSSTGTINRTYNVDATCNLFNETYGYYTCSINANSTCTPGALSCSGNPSGNFEMMEVPDTAIFVHTQGGGDQLHVGLLKDSSACSVNVSGDYVYIRTGTGSRDLFGIYRSDADFESVTHADFAMVAASSTATPAVTYVTNDVGGNVSLVDTGCSSGVRTRTVSGNTMRAMMTNSGLFILDMPAGQGGLVSFKMANAAVLADLANKTFGGISFPDNSSPQPLNVVTGAVSGSAVLITGGDAGGNPITGADLRPLTNTTSGVSNPAYPNFTTAPSNGTFAYSTNALQATYGNPSTFPGFFRVDGALGDTGRVVLAAAKLNNKVVGFGFVYNYRTSSNTNPATGSPFSPDGLYNTGNFIIFER